MRHTLFEQKYKEKLLNTEIKVSYCNELNIILFNYEQLLEDWTENFFYTKENLF